MINERKVANSMEDITEAANVYSLKIKPLMESIRYHIDKLEILVDDEMWTLPKYREMLFVK